LTFIEKVCLKIYSPEQIVEKFGEADKIIATGGTVEQVCKQLGVIGAAYYNWRKQYGKINSTR
jgi:transposase-like protein